MGRSGYSDDFGDDDPLAMGRYRQAVKRAIEGKRGQAFLHEMAAALDAMPEKRLLADVFADPDGQCSDTRGCCAMGAVALARGITDRDKLEDAEEPEVAASMLGIAESMAREIAFENDDDFGISRNASPEQRWTHMRAWVARHIGNDQHPVVLRENAIKAQRYAAQCHGYATRAGYDRAWQQENAALASSAAREAFGVYQNAIAKCQP